MKKRKTCFVTGVLLAVTALGASGCDKMVHTTVIAEQMEGEGQVQASAPAGVGSVSEQVKAPERYTVNTSWDQAVMTQDYVDDPEQEKLKTAGIYAGDVVWGDDTDTEYGAAEGEPGRELQSEVQAALDTADEGMVSRNVTEQHITLTADADIEVPEAEAIHLKRIRAVPLQEETAKKWIEVLTGGEQNVETEAADGESGGRNGTVTGKMTVDQLPYTYIYQQLPQQNDADKYGTEGQRFLVNADWASIRRTADGLENTETGERITGTVRTREDCLKETERLLRAMGLSEFIQNCYISSEKVTYGWQAAEDENTLISRTTLVLERSVDQIPVTGTFFEEYPLYQEGTAESTEGAKLWMPEFLQLGYTEGRLVDFSYIEPVEISDYSDEALFLLPFEEIRQIFENTIGEKMVGAGNDTDKVTENQDGIVTVWKQYPDTVFDNVAVNIHKVRLGYMRVRDEEALTAGTKEGLLIPVWDFFGTWTASGTQENGKTVGEKMESEDISLLTIDARDGTVLQRMVGY